MSSPNDSEPHRPVAAAYISTFLPSDMRHVYRQVDGLVGFKAAVLARKRQNDDSFPIHKKQITVLPKPGSGTCAAGGSRRSKRSPSR